MWLKAVLFLPVCKVCWKNALIFLLVPHLTITSYLTLIHIYDKDKQKEKFFCFFFYVGEKEKVCSEIAVGIKFRYLACTVFVASHCSPVMYVVI